MYMVYTWYILCICRRYKKCFDICGIHGIYQKLGSRFRLGLESFLISWWRVMPNIAKVLQMWPRVTPFVCVHCTSTGNLSSLPVGVLTNFFKSAWICRVFWPAVSRCCHIASSKLWTAAGCTAGPGQLHGAHWLFLNRAGVLLHSTLPAPNPAQAS